MKNCIGVFLLLALLPVLALAATTDRKTGAQLTYEVPVYNPALPATDPDSYGRYPLSDVLNSMLPSITPAAIGAAQAVHGHPSSEISDSTAAGRQILTGADLAAIRTLLNVPDGATNDYLQLINRPTLGDAAAKNTGTIAGTVAAGDHTQAAATISDSTAAGRAMLTAPTAADQRTLLGTDQATDPRDPNAHGHPTTDLSDATSWGQSILQAIDAGAGRTLMGFTIGTAAGNVPQLVALGPCTPLGICTDGISSTKGACDAAAGTWTAYDSAALCATAGGSWGTSVGFPFTAADFPAGNLTVDGIPVDPGSGAWDGITGKPSTYPPDTHTHEQTDITGLVARLVALEGQVTQLDADLSLAGFPVLTINQSSPVEFATATTTLTGTATDNGTVTALEYNIAGGAWANITPLASPWSLELAGASLTPNVATAVNIRATDDTALERTRSANLIYQTPVASLSGGSGAFGEVTVSETSAAQIYTLTNPGLADLVITTAAITGTDAARFVEASDTCPGATLTPCGTCAINVTYTPNAAVAHSASLEIAHNATGSPTTLALSGTGVASSASVTDDFNRADGALGANWTKPAYSAATLVISSNRVVSDTYGVTAVAYHSGSTFANNQYSQIKMNSSISGYTGPGCRMNPEGDGYIAEAYNSTSLAVRRLDNGVATTIGSGITGLTLLNSTVKITCSGSTIEVFVDDVSVGSRTDATYGSGSPWIETNQSGGIYSMDNFAAGDL
jgi:hypothetical protein